MASNSVKTVVTMRPRWFFYPAVRLALLIDRLGLGVDLDRLLALLTRYGYRYTVTVE
jgi:hypothetical protein